MPLNKKTELRFRYRWITPTYRQRLAFKGKKVVEVSGYVKRKSGKWVNAYNKEKVITKIKEYRKNNRTQILLKKKEYRSKPEVKERMREYLKNYRIQNHERIESLKRAWEKEHREQNNLSKIKYQKSEKGKLSYTKQTHKRLATLKNLKEHFTIQELLELREKNGDYCPCCHTKVGRNNLTLDHVIPLSKGGTNTIDNIQLLCLSCNSRKHNRNCIRYEIFNPIEMRLT